MPRLPLSNSSLMPKRKKKQKSFSKIITLPEEFIFRIFTYLNIKDSRNFGSTAKRLQKSYYSFLEKFFGFKLPDDKQLNNLLFTKKRLPFLPTNLNDFNLAMRIENYLYGTPLHDDDEKTLFECLKGEEIWITYFQALLSIKHLDKNGLIRFIASSTAYIEHRQTGRALTTVEDSALSKKIDIILKTLFLIKEYCDLNNISDQQTLNIITNCFFGFKHAYKGILTISSLKEGSKKSELEKSQWLTEFFKYLKKNYFVAELEWLSDLSLSGIQQPITDRVTANIKLLSSLKEPHRHHYLRCFKAIKKLMSELLAKSSVYNLFETLDKNSTHFITTLFSNAEKDLIVAGQLLADFFNNKYSKLNNFLGIKKNYALALGCYLTVFELYNEKKPPDTLHEAIITAYRRRINELIYEYAFAHPKIDKSLPDYSVRCKQIETTKQEAYDWFQMHKTEFIGYQTALDELALMKSEPVGLFDADEKNTFKSQVDAKRNEEKHTTVELKKEAVANEFGILETSPPRYISEATNQELQIKNIPLKKSGAEQVKKIIKQAINQKRKRYDFSEDSGRVQNCFLKIIYGYIDAYSEFLNILHETDLKCSRDLFRELLNKTIEHDDIAKCNYNFLYDISQYLIESHTIPRVEKEQLADKLLAKLMDASARGNSGARVAAIMLIKNVLNKNPLPDELTQFLEHTRLTSLSIITRKLHTNKKRRPQIKEVNNHPDTDKIAWANLFLGIEEHFKKKVPSNTYLSAAYNAKNSAASHFINYYIESPTDLRILFLTNHAESPNDLACINILFAELFHKLSASKIISPSNSNLTSKRRHALLMVNNYKHYNYAKAKMLEGEFCLDAAQGKIVNSIQKAKSCFEKANKYAYPGAQERLTECDKLLEMIGSMPVNNNNSNVINSNDLRVSKIAGVRYKEANNYQFYFKAFYDTKVIDGNLDLIEPLINNDQIRSVKFTDIRLEFPFDKVLDIIKNRHNIKKIIISSCLLSIKDWLKIFLHIQQSVNITDFEIKGANNFFDYEKKRDVDELSTLFEKFIFNLIENKSNWQEIKLQGLPLDTTEKTNKFLLALKKNSNIKNARIIVNNILINKNTVTTLCELLNTHVKYFDIERSQDELDSGILSLLINKLENNSSLNHLSLQSFIQDSDDIGHISKFYDLINILIKTTKIESINLSNTLFIVNEKNFNENHLFSVMCSNLKKNKHIKHLDLSMNRLNDNEIKQIAYIFKHNSNIETLNISDTEIYSDYPTFSMNSLETLFDTLSRHSNNLRELNFGHCLEDDNFIDDYPKLVKMILNFLESQECKLISMHLPLPHPDTVKGSHLFDEFVQGIAKNKTLNSLYFTGWASEDNLKSLIRLAEVNPRIIRIKFDKREGKPSKQLRQELDSALIKNQSLIIKSEVKTAPLVISTSNNNNAVLEEILPKPKASLQTLIKIFADIKNIKYEIKSFESNKNLLIKFEENQLSQTAHMLFKQNNILSTLTEDGTIIENYFDLEEYRINSLALIIKVNLLKKNSNTTVPKIGAYFFELKNIVIVEDDEKMTIDFKDNAKITNEQKRTIVSSFSAILNAKNIQHSVTSSTLITISKNQSIDTKQLDGIAGAFKKVMKENYNTLKEPKKSSFLSIQKKLKNKKNNNNLKPGKTVEDTKQNKNEVSVASISNANLKVEEAVSQEPIETQPNYDAPIELFPFGYQREMPTEVRFQDLIANLRSQQEKGELPPICNKSMLLLLDHYESLVFLTKAINDQTILAYCLVYHCLRIIELLNNFVRENFAKKNQTLSLSTLAMAIVIADQTDYFLPDNPQLTVNSLTKHPQSFLTVSKQILLDIFKDDSLIKTKLVTGFTNVPFYKSFFPNSLPTPTTKLPVNTSLSKDPINVIKSIQSVIKFANIALVNCTISEMLEGNSFTNVKLCTAKTIIFLIGHFSRILRDHHNAFCQQYLSSTLADKDYSRELDIELSHLLDKSYLYQNKYLIKHVEKFTEDQAKQIAKVATLSDLLMLCIESRNTIRHNNPEDSEAVLCAFDEISPSLAAYISLHFIATDKFEKKLANLLDVHNKPVDTSLLTNNNNVMAQSAKKFNPNSKPYVPKGLEEGEKKSDYRGPSL